MEATEPRGEKELFFSKTAEELIQQIFKEDLLDESILKPAKMTNQIGYRNTWTLRMQKNKNILLLEKCLSWIPPPPKRYK